MRVVLASGSPRRRELLGLLGLDPEIIISSIDETALAGETPVELVARLAPAKARAVLEVLELRGSTSATVVVAADTTVDLDGEILATPADTDEARRMLAALSGRAHRVHTGVAVWSTGERVEELLSVVTSEVVFDDLDDALIDWYLACGESLDKAGGYAIQGHGGALVRAVHGSVTNVIGLPLAELRAMLSRVGVVLSRRG